MAATYTKRGKRSWLISVDWQGQRERRTIHGTEQDAKELVKFIHKQELAGVNVVETIRAARVATAPASPAAWPRLRDDMPAFVEYQVSVG